MALKRLRTGEMAQLSLPWVTENSEAQKVILAIPELAGLLPRIVAGHKALHDSQAGSTDPRLAKVVEKAARLDLRHDEIVRGAYWLLTALAWLAGAGETADNLLRLRDLLFPEGLDAAQKPYREEAGATDMLKSRIAADATAKKELKEIPVLKKNLGQLVDELVAVGKKLGETEDARALLLANPAPSDGAKAVAARNKWIRAVNALVTNAELAELDDATKTTLLGALRHADKMADRRKATPQDELADEPTDDAAAPAVDPATPPTK